MPDRYSKLISKLISFAIAGHHAGLANGAGTGDGRRTLELRLKQEFGTGQNKLPPLDEKAWREQLESSIPPLDQLLPPITLHPDKNQRGFQFAFLIRMIFSCLVDADFIDTDKFYKKLEGKPWLRGEYPSLAELKPVFAQYLESKAKLSEPTKVNQLRREILHHARSKASEDPGLFTLTVPTGGGKTLSSMAFALDHALKYQMRRIIYVIPFTSIIEQNAKVFREAFGELGQDAVLEHHSNFDVNKIKNEEMHEKTEDKLNLAMENWDMPVVVTTAVQFFESLFADRPSRCRKLHNISGSVIILDEAQTLPLKFLKPVMAAIDELARNYHCSLVLCTATQPALAKSDDFKQGFTHVREIAPDPKRLFRELSLVQVEHLGELTDAKVIARMQQHRQILTIVNNRRQAQALFKELKAQQKAEQGDGIFHLTTLMCAAHRTQTLDEIRKRLADKTQPPCRVVSTSLIEAGVDVDFPCVMRTEAGLDSIAQAAGRCNRERKHAKEKSHVWVFRSPDWKMPPELESLAGATNSTLRAIERGDFDNPLGEEAIKNYFLDVYWQKGDELDKKAILKACRERTGSFDFPFQDIARDFRIIEDFMQPIFIPFDKTAESLLEELKDTDEVSKTLRKLQPYIVQLPQQGFNSLVTAKVVEKINERRFKDQFWKLINMNIYDEEFGIFWDDPTFMKAESLVA